jgi:hypothetical protein
MPPGGAPLDVARRVSGQYVAAAAKSWRRASDQVGEFQPMSLKVR